MKTKTEYSLTLLSLLSLMAINYYVSSSTVKYDLNKKESTKIVEDKKIDKVVTVKKESNKVFTGNKQSKIPVIPTPDAINDKPLSLLEMSVNLGVPITHIEESEITYPE